MAALCPFQVRIQYFPTHNSTPHAHYNCKRLMHIRNSTSGSMLADIHQNVLIIYVLRPRWPFLIKVFFTNTEFVFERTFNAVYIFHAGTCIDTAIQLNLSQIETFISHICRFHFFAISFVIHFVHWSNICNQTKLICGNNNIMKNNSQFNSAPHLKLLTLLLRCEFN